LGVPYATAADGHDALPSVAAVEQKLMNYTDRSRQVLSWGGEKTYALPGGGSLDRHPFCHRRDRCQRQN